MNSEQLHFFRTFGYIVLRQLLNKDDLTQLVRDHRDALATQYSAERNTGAERDPFTKAVSVTPARSNTSNPTVRTTTLATGSTTLSRAPCAGAGSIASKK